MFNVPGERVGNIVMMSSRKSIALPPEQEETQICEKYSYSHSGAKSNKSLRANEKNIPFGL